MQPLGCSKELLPVGSRRLDDADRPKAVAEYLVERMIAAGAEQVCLVISAEKSDIVRYFAEHDYAAEIFFAVQRQPRGLCDAIFRAEPFARSHDAVLIGLPDTIWFPENGLSRHGQPGKHLAVRGSKHVHNAGRDNIASCFRCELSGSSFAARSHARQFSSATPNRLVRFLPESRVFGPDLPKPIGPRRAVAPARCISRAFKMIAS